MIYLFNENKEKIAISDNIQLPQNSMTTFTQLKNVNWPVILISSGLKLRPCISETKQADGVSPNER